MYLVAFHVVFKILVLLLPLFIYSFIFIFNIKSEIIIDYRGQILPPLKLPPGADRPLATKLNSSDICLR